MFRILKRIDRSLIDSAIIVTDTIRSVGLSNRLTVLTNKLETSMKTHTMRAIGAIGIPLAQKISVIAQKFGDESAKYWVFDQTFSTFLAIIHINYHFILKNTWS